MLSRLRNIFRAKPLENVISPPPSLLANVYDHTGTCQSACPVCDYGQGYLEPFICVSYELKEVTCKVCNAIFMAPVTFNSPAGREALND